MWPSATVDSVMKQQEINLDFSRRQVMTIVNVTPDSFFAGSRTPDWLDVERRVREAVEAGDRKSTRLNSSHSQQSRMPSSA